MKKKLIFCLAIAMIILSFTACSLQTNKKENNNGKLSIVTTIFPQYDFAREIAGDKADIHMLLKPGAESHSYEPTPQDIKTIQNCDLFIYTGGENDVWVDDILNSMGDKKPETLKLVDCVTTVNEEVVEGMEHEHEHEHSEIKESDIKDRQLSDFSGKFKSVLPYFENGTLDDYITEEAKEHELSFDEMKAKFLKKRSCDYNRLVVKGNKVLLEDDNEKNSASYEYAGYKTVKDDDGDIKSVWYTYKTKSSVKGMPTYLALNDHGIGTKTKDSNEDKEEISHLHIRYGNESIDALIDVDDWAPTFFDNSATDEQIKKAVEGHSHGEEIDEHVWTSPKNAIKIVNKISSLMCNKDERNADTYKNNTQIYLKKLEDLDKSFADVVNNSKRKTIIFGDRFPFRYLVDEYGINYYAAFTGCSTETEASAATISFLIDKVKEEKTPVVFTIELSNGKIADSICEATGAKKITFNSCHNLTKDEIEAGETYLSLMTKNVESLKSALN